MEIERNNYFHLIADVDKVLDSLRILLQLATTPEEKAKVKKSMDMVLDQRLEYMKGRDAVGQVAVPL